LVYILISLFLACFNKLSFNMNLIIKSLIKLAKVNNTLMSRAKGERGSHRWYFRSQVRWDGITRVNHRIWSIVCYSFVLKMRLIGLKEEESVSKLTLVSTRKWCETIECTKTILSANCITCLHPFLVIPVALINPTLQ